MGSLREVFGTFGIGFDTAQLMRGVKAVDETAKKTKEVSKEMAGADKEAKALSTSIKGLVSAIGVGGLLRGVVGFIQGTIGLSLSQADAARGIGTSAQAMREWTHVAEASGLPAEVMSSALQTLSQNMRSVQMGNGDMAYAFRRLHVPIRDANRNLRDTSDVMAEAGVAITSIANPTRRARLAVQVFGEAGRQLVPIFEQGATSIQGMRDEVRELLGGNMQEMEAQSRLVRAETARLNLSMEAFSNTVVLQLLPVYRYIMQGVTGIVRVLKNWSQETYIVNGLMVAAIPVLIALFYQLGVAMLASFGPALLAIAPFVVGLAALVLVADELFALFNGGDSLIGRFIDSLLGVGEAQQVVQDLKRFYDELIGVVADGIEITVNSVSYLFSGLVRAGEFVLGIISRVAGAIRSIPGVGRLLGALGVGSSASTGNIPQQATRGFIAPSSLVAGGARGRATSIDARTNANITIQGTSDPETTANLVATRLREESEAGVQRIRPGLVRTVQQETEET